MFKTKINLFFGIVSTIIILIIELQSFWWVSNYVQNRARLNIEESLTQVDTSIEYLIENVYYVSKIIVADNNMINYMSKNGGTLDNDEVIRLNALYSSIVNASSSIESVAYFNDRKYFETYSISTPKGKYDSFKQLKVKVDFDIYRPYERYYSTLGTRNVVSFYKRTLNSNNLAEELGILRIDVLESAIEETYSYIDVYDSGSIFIINKNGFIISHENKELLSTNIFQQPLFEDKKEQIIENEKQSYLKTIDGVEYLVTTLKESDHGLYYVACVPYNDIIESLMSYRNSTIIITIIAFITLFTVFNYISSKVSAPITKLNHIIKNVEINNFDVIIPVTSKDEIGEMAESVNNLIKKINELIKENYETKILKNEAELVALQSQISPHFLYNTLDIAIWSAKAENAELTEEIVLNIASFFRLGLNDGNIITTVENEIAHLKSYVSLQNLRYDEPPEVIYIIDEDILDLNIIKLILQPFVENSYQHGFVEGRDDYRLEVHGYIMEDDLIFQIIDNGVGFNTNLNSSLTLPSPQRKGYGVRNVDERIKLDYGDDYGVEISSQVNVGTTVRLTLKTHIN